MNYAVGFSEILYANKAFILQTDSDRLKLSAGVSEYYILMNLAAEVKCDGVMIVELGEIKNKPALLPVAVISESGVTWIKLTEDDETGNLPDVDPQLLDAFKTGEGERYPDGFITPARTSLSYGEVMKCEAKLHEPYGDYWDNFHNYYQYKYPGQRYDVRLHYYMIKGIRKNAHRTDDFLSADRFNFYPGWEDPFPWYLYTETFGGPDTWPSYARMRLMADNYSAPCIPTALKVLKSKKANDRIRHYAIVLAGLDEASDEIIGEFSESCPRALLKVYYNRRSSKFYPMLLDNARRLVEFAESQTNDCSDDESDLQQAPEDILDDPREVYMPEYGKYENFTIAQRGVISFDFLTLEQVRELWSHYKLIAIHIDDHRMDEMKRLRLGNAFRAFLVALVYNQTKAVGEIMWDVYCNHNHLLYGIWSQDSHYKETDIMWCRYLFDYVKVNDLLENFWQRLHKYAKGYDSYCVYSNQRFFLAIYFRVAYHVLSPEDFYDVLARLIDISYTNVTIAWQGVTDNESLPDDAPALDHRWENMFCCYNYYTWTGSARYYYDLVAHKIDPHPEGWSDELWQQNLQKKKKFRFGVPDYL